MFALGSGIDNSLNLNVFLNSISDASNKHEVPKKRLNGSAFPSNAILMVGYTEVIPKPSFLDCGMSATLEATLITRDLAVSQQLSGSAFQGSWQGLLPGIQFPDTALIIPCSIQRKKCCLIHKWREMFHLHGPTLSLCGRTRRISLYFSLLAGNSPEKGSLVTASSASRLLKSSVLSGSLPNPVFRFDVSSKANLCWAAPSPSAEVPQFQSRPIGVDSIQSGV